MAARAQYAGSEACRECHAAESASQSRTGHAAALARSTKEQPGDWAFGAGQQAITFVKQLDEGHYLEMAQSWYRASHSMALTPGHHGPAGVQYRTFDPAAGIVKCFACHSTGSLTVGDDGAIQPAEAGVRCESCHGPAAAHAANPRVVSPRNPGRMNGPQMNALCGTCHRVLATADDAANLLDPWNARHQPLLLAASACFQKSNGRLSCSTCHAAHQPLNVTAESYNSACRSCHAQVRHTTPVAAQACTECHMPEVRVSQTLAFANHRIAVYAPGEAVAPVTAWKKAAADGHAPTPGLGGPARSHATRP